MRLKILLSLTILAISLSSQVINGSMDITNWDWSGNPVIDLSGRWLVEGDGGSVGYRKVPGNWGSNRGTGTYKINLISSGEEDLLLSTSQLSTEVIITHNGKRILEDRVKRSHNIPISLVSGDNIIKFIISNQLNVHGGIRNTPLIGRYNEMLKVYERSVLSDIISSGASFIIFILFLSLYLYHKEDEGSLYIAFVCFLIFIRGFVTNDFMIYSFIDLPFLLVNRIEYGTIYFLPFSLLMFCRDFFSKRDLKILHRILIYTGLFFGSSVVILPTNVYLSLYKPFLIYGLITSIYLIILLLVLTIIGEEDAIRIFLSVLTLVLASAYDISIVFFQASNQMILSRVIIIFILLMAYIVSYRQLRNIKKISTLSNHNYQVNKYFSKFVPKEFINTIGGASVNYIKKGDGARREMTILFSSIMDFYKTSRLLSGDDVINLLNKCFSIVSPIIIKNGGFVDKFMDETIMCIFPNDPHNAVNAALEISEAFRMESIKSGQKIKMLSGIHIGEIYVGIVGDENRVDATVISKVVNTASRIASFTKKIDREILVSEDVVKYVTEKDVKHHYMGRVRLKGSERSIGIYSIDTYRDANKSFQEKEADNLFSMTMRKLEKSSLDRIEQVLLNIKKLYYHHKPTLYYLKLLNENRRLEDLEK